MLTVDIVILLWWLVLLTLQNLNSARTWALGKLSVGITFISLIEILRLIHCGCHHFMNYIIDSINEGKGSEWTHGSILLCHNCSYEVIDLLPHDLAFTTHCHSVAWDYESNKPFSLKLLTPGRETKYLY